MTLSTSYIKDNSDYYWKTIDTVNNKKSNQITFFIDTEGVSTTWHHSGDGIYDISAVSIPNFISTFINDSFISLDQILDIDFKRVYKSEDAIIKIIHTDMSSIPGMGDHSGAASSIYSGTYYDWSLGKWRADNLSLEVIVKDDWIYNSTGKNNYFQEYLLLHEIGHLLTLEHPFEDSDGDVYGDDYGSNAVKISQTLMAYESNNEAYPNWFTSLDLQALKEIWGENFAPTNWNL